MNANIEIGGRVIQVTDETLAQLNAVLAQTPVMESKWEGDEKIQTVNPTKRIQLEAVYELKTREVKAPNVHLNRAL